MTIAQYIGYGLLSLPFAGLVVFTFYMLPKRDALLIWLFIIGALVCLLGGTYLISGGIVEKGC